MLFTSYTIPDILSSFPTRLKKKSSALLLQVQVSAKAAGEFSSPHLTFYVDSYSMSIPPCITTEDPSHSAKSAGTRSHLKKKKHTPLTQQRRSGLSMLSRHCVGTYEGNKLTCNSSGKTQPHPSQLAEPLWTDPGLKSGIGVCAS